MVKFHGRHETGSVMAGAASQASGDVCGGLAFDVNTIVTTLASTSLNRNVTENNAKKAG